MDASTLAKSIAALEAEQWRSFRAVGPRAHVRGTKCFAEHLETGARSDGLEGEIDKK